MILIKQSVIDDELLLHEYSIAHFLESHVPSFLAAPFALMRGINEKLSFVQQPIHGDTLRNLNVNAFSQLDLCHIFLRYIEFLLPVGGTFSMKDVDFQNIMVTNPPQCALKFIDFEHWQEIKDPSQYTLNMLHNFWKSERGLRFLLRTMGYDNLNGILPVQRAEYEKAEVLTFLYELSINIMTNVVQPITSKIPEGCPEIEGQLNVIRKLCSIKSSQVQLGIPMGMIDERVNLDELEF